LTATSALADPDAYLEIALKIAPKNRVVAAAIHTKYKEPFLATVAGVETRALLERDDDVQVLHGFDTVASAKAYLAIELFTHDVFVALKPLVLDAAILQCLSWTQLSGKTRADMSGT